MISGCIALPPRLALLRDIREGMGASRSRHRGDYPNPVRSASRRLSLCTQDEEAG
jgi:hypothetical protein